MQITPLFLVLAAVIGLLIGLLVSSLFSSRESKSVDKDTPPADLAKDGFAEAARIWYGPSGEKVITELDGAYYRDFLVLSPEQKTRVKKLIGLWSNWAGIAPAQENQDAPSFAAISTPAATNELPPHQPILDCSVAEAIKSEKKVEVKPVADRPKTIAGQISAIIDKMLTGNPLREKGIKLIENDHHGVDVWIGLEKFDGIDAIPYPEVQQLIREAVTEWEHEMEASRNLP
jgi:hypothetical protein